MVILPNTNTQGAIAVAERIHTTIKELQIPHQDSDANNIVTISMGLACTIPKLEISPYVMINQADQAMYSAKQQGRNRSILFAE
jgi:diguanylate cyclase (GGDEF)-like protein